MDSFLIDKCRSCLTTNINLKECMVMKDKEIKCFDAVKTIFPDIVMPVYFGYGYSLCETCINLLRCALSFQRRLSQSHYAYNKYVKTLDEQMIETDEESGPKPTKNPCNPIPNSGTCFQDTLTAEDLNFDTSLLNDFNNFLGELDAKLDIGEHKPVKTSQEQSKNIDNVIADSIKKEVLISDNDNCNQMDFNSAENIVHVENIKEEHDKDIPTSDNDSCYQLVSKVKVEELTAPWDSTKKGNEPFEAVYICEEQCKNEISANNLSATDFKEEIITSINSEEKTSAILSTKRKVDHKRKRSMECHDCKLTFSSNSYLIEHKRIHLGERPYKCDICEKSFSFASSLLVHKRIHSGERPFECDLCEKSFYKNSHLIGHKRTHTRERPFKCDVCEQSFSSPSILSRHKRIHTRERPFKCDVCEKSFSVTTQLILHKRIHTGERPYKCDICGKSFARGPGLVVHKRRHTGERPYKCDVCELSFSHSNSLSNHKRIHSGEQPYKCNICEESFAQKYVLVIHKRIHTK